MTGSALRAVRCIMANFTRGELEGGSDPIAFDRSPADFAKVRNRYLIFEPLQERSKVEMSRPCRLVSAFFQKLKGQNHVGSFFCFPFALFLLWFCCKESLLTA